MAVLKTDASVRRPPVLTPLIASDETDALASGPVYSPRLFERHPLHPVGRWQSDLEFKEYIYLL